MRSLHVLAALVAALVVVPVVSAQERSDLSGQWTLDRTLSQFPDEVGFGVEFAPTPTSGQASAPAASRGRRGSAGGRAPAPGASIARPESEDDAKRTEQLTAEVRTPPAFLAVAETATAVTVTNDQGKSRTFHPGGREDILPLDGVPVAATEKWMAGRLVVSYQVSDGRELRYTYSRSVNPQQLVVDIEFVERESQGSIRRVYRPTTALDLAAKAAPTSPPIQAPATPAPGTSAAPATPPAAPAAALPSTGPGAAQPDAELKGLQKLGLVVEGLTGQAAACGLSASPIESAAMKSLSDAGLSVLKNSDEDTYVYVNIATTNVSAGLCVSRWDVFLYSYTSTALSYHKAPVLVQVELMHKGGLAGGSPSAHADGVVRGVKDYIDEVASRIRNANK